MKLLVVSHACATAINQQLYAELTALTGWDISLVVPSNWRDEYGQSCRADRWPSFTGELLPTSVRRAGSIILHTYRASFRALIERLGPDAVYVNHEPYALATAQVYWGNRRANGRRAIGFYSCQNIFKRYPPPFRWSEAWVLKKSDFFFPISKAVEDVFRHKGYRGVSKVLPLAIDGNVYRPREAADVRRELGVRDEEVLLGYVGRFVPAKGLATLIDSLQQIADLHWRFALMGAGEMEGELRQRINAAGLADRVHFAGFVPHAQVPQLMSALDVLVLPSETQANWREQFGRVLLEAMACGTPVVGSDSGEIPTLVRDTGGGLIARERDASSLAGALRRMIVDPDARQAFARAGAAAVADRYSMASAAREFASTVDRAVYDQRRGAR